MRWDRCVRSCVRRCRKRRLRRCGRRSAGEFEKTLMQSGFAVVTAVLLVESRRTSTSTSPLDRGLRGERDAICGLLHWRQHAHGESSALGTGRVELGKVWIWQPCGGGSSVTTRWGCERRRDRIGECPGPRPGSVGTSSYGSLSGAAHP